VELESTELVSPDSLKEGKYPNISKGAGKKMDKKTSIFSIPKLDWETYK
jgi:hypothetical protein